MGVLSFLADVLFVGHSLIGPGLPPLVEQALRQMGEPAVVEAQLIDGATLTDSWENSATAMGVDARTRLIIRPADVLVLTEAEPIAARVAQGDTAARLADFAQLATRVNPRARVLLYEVWPPLTSGPGSVKNGSVIAGDPDAGIAWRDRLTRDLPLWQGAVTAAAELSGADIKLLPAGQAMGRLADAIDAGSVPGITTIADMFEDDIHPNAQGLYFLAMLHAGAITGRSPEGLPAKLGRSWASRDAVIPPELARALQRIAWSSLQAYKPGKGTIFPTTTTTTTATATVAPPAAAAAIPPMPAFAPITNQHLALGLAGINDWSVQQPFLDIMKTARPWIGHLPGQWGGWGHDDLAARGYLDANGWPNALPPELTGISTLVLTDLPMDAAGVAGRYQLRYTGTGTLKIEGRAVVVQTEPGLILFDYTPGTGAVLLTIQATDPADPLRDITILREDRVAAHAKGALFNPDWLARIRGVRSLRLMDWMATNNSTLALAANRPRPADYTYARNGVPMEVMVALANALNADAWFTIPHLAEDALVRDMASIAETGLNPALRAYVEFSNEVWNWQFTQAAWADGQAKARWNQPDAWVQFYALRAAEVADIWAATYADAPERLVRVIGVQTGWLGLEQQILDSPLVLAEGRNPADSFDAYAVAGYFSAQLGSDAKAPAVQDWLAQSEAAARDAAAALGLTGADAGAHIAAHRFDLATRLAAQELRDGSVTGDAADSLSQVLAEVLPYHATVAADRGLKLLMYEGGSHVVGLGAQADDAALTDFFIHLNYSPEMGALYETLLAGWQLQSDAPFNAFVDTFTPGKWGSWGALRHLGDDNPRWQALARGCTTC